MIEAGSRFPDFSLPDQDNRTLKLNDFIGRWLVLYVYPKDDTPGCTLEGRAFSAAKPEFDRLNAVVVGISQDDVSSHKGFCDKYGFTIPLLADTSGDLLRKVGVGQTEWQGTMYWDRTTFLVDPNGVVRKVYLKVKPQDHEKQVLEDLRQLTRGILSGTA
jgi:thioredoxin-dependent peroxiredoxin